MIKDIKIKFKNVSNKIKHPSKLKPMPIDRFNFWFFWLSLQPHANPPKKVIIIEPYANWKIIKVLLTSPPIIQGNSEKKANGRNPM